MNIDDRRPATDLRAHSHILQTFQMVVTLQRVHRFPTVWFDGQIQDGGRRPFKKTSNSHISETHYPINFNRAILCPV